MISSQFMEMNGVNLCEIHVQKLMAEDSGSVVRHFFISILQFPQVFPATTWDSTQIAGGKWLTVATLHTFSTLCVAFATTLDITMQQ